ncbi:MAG: hypothetical protein AAB425_12535 [Bdellovibrionota bacterium]
MKNTKIKTILLTALSLLSTTSCNWSSDSVFGKNPEEVEVREEGHSYGGSHSSTDSTNTSTSCTASRSELVARTTLFDEPGRTCSNPNGYLGGAKINADGNLLVWVYMMEDEQFPAVLDVRYKVKFSGAVIRFGTCTNRDESMVWVTTLPKRDVLSTQTEVTAPGEEVAQPAPTPSPEPTATSVKMREILCTPTVTTSKIAGTTITVTSENNPTNGKDSSYEITDLALINEACESTASTQFNYETVYNVPCGISSTVYTTIEIGEIEVPRFVYANVP